MPLAGRHARGQGLGHAGVGEDDGSRVDVVPEQPVGVVCWRERVSARSAAPSMNESVAGHLFVRIDPRAREPLQTQIYASIRRAILDGVVQPGARLPSSRALAADLGISRTTTVLAFDQLAAEGYLTARSGSGTFVTRELPDDRPRPSVAARARPGSTRRSRVAALRSPRRRRRRSRSPALRARSASARPRSIASRSSVDAARQPPPEIRHSRTARLRRRGRPASAA